jgi:hypothetical protein
MYVSIQDMIDLMADQDMHLSDSPEMHVNMVPKKQSPDNDYQDSEYQHFGSG